MNVHAASYYRTVRYGYGKTPGLRTFIWETKLLFLISKSKNLLFQHRLSSFLPTIIIIIPRSFNYIKLLFFQFLDKH